MDLLKLSIAHWNHNWGLTGGPNLATHPNLASIGVTVTKEFVQKIHKHSFDKRLQTGVQ